MTASFHKLKRFRPIHDSLISQGREVLGACNFSCKIIFTLHYNSTEQIFDIKHVKQIILTLTHVFLNNTHSNSRIPICFGDSSIRNRRFLNADTTVPNSSMILNNSNCFEREFCLFNFEDA